MSDIYPECRDLAEFLKTLAKPKRKLTPGEQKYGKRVGFNMRSAIPEEFGAPDHSGQKCESAVCFAGWVLLRDGVVPVRKMDHPEDLYDPIAMRAQKRLGLDHHVATELLNPRVPGGSNTWGKIGLKASIRTLLHCAETGQVDWGLGPLEDAHP